MRVTLRVVWSVVFALLPAFAVAASAHAAPFSDVADTTPYHEAIETLSADGLLTGYVDGSFRPYRTLNRAEFVKLIVASQIDPHGEDCKTLAKKPFADVPTDAWFARSACSAKGADVIEGYANGTFAPAKTVTLAEASVMLARTFGETLPDDEKPWYRSSLAYLVDHDAVPPTLGNPDQAITRNEFAEMLWRLREGKKELACPSLDSLLTSTCKTMDDGVPSVDMQEVQRQWLQWTNDARADLGLPAYAMDRQLDRTALIWSAQASEKGSISHKRPGQSAYYDYHRMVGWFDDLGLEFENVDRITFTENIGYGYYTCAKADCTGDLIKAVRTTFDFFMAEKNKADRPHYNSIMNPHFQSIGVGIVVDPGSKRYFLTVHYGTEIVSAPAPVCL